MYKDPAKHRQQCRPEGPETADGLEGHVDLTTQEGKPHCISKLSAENMM